MNNMSHVTEIIRNGGADRSSPSRPPSLNSSGFRWRNCWSGKETKLIYGWPFCMGSLHVRCEAEGIAAVSSGVEKAEIVFGQYLRGYCGLGATWGVKRHADFKVEASHVRL